MEGLYEGFWLRGFRWWGSRTVHSSDQGLCRHHEPFSPSAHCAWQVMEGGLPEEGRCHQSFCVLLLWWSILWGSPQTLSSSQSPCCHWAQRPLWSIRICCPGWLLPASGFCVPQPVLEGISSLAATGIPMELRGVVFATWVAVPISKKKCSQEWKTLPF